MRKPTLLDAIRKGRDEYMKKTGLSLEECIEIEVISFLNNPDKPILEEEDDDESFIHI